MKYILLVSLYYCLTTVTFAQNAFTGELEYKWIHNSKQDTFVVTYYLDDTHTFIDYSERDKVLKNHSPHPFHFYDLEQNMYYRCDSSFNCSVKELVNYDSVLVFSPTGKTQNVIGKVCEIYNYKVVQRYPIYKKRYLKELDEMKYMMSDFEYDENVFDLESRKGYDETTRSYKICISDELTINQSGSYSSSEILNNINRISMLTELRSATYNNERFIDPVELDISRWIHILYDIHNNLTIDLDSLQNTFTIYDPDNIK